MAGPTLGLLHELTPSTRKMFAHRGREHWTYLVYRPTRRLSSIFTTELGRITRVTITGNPMNTLQVPRPSQRLAVCLLPLCHLLHPALRPPPLLLHQHYREPHHFFLLKNYGLCDGLAHCLLYFTCYWRVSDGDNNFNTVPGVSICSRWIISRITLPLSIKNNLDYCIVLTVSAPRYKFGSGRS
jgi:hypothetical protein